jgi:glutamine amidotransferase
MIAIIDYKAGNLTSVKLALDAIGAEAKITDVADEILAAEHVIFPGVGAAGSAMRTLNDRGLVDVIRKVAAKGTPFMGICLGTQIILSHSEEDDADCIGLLDGDVIKFQPTNPRDKVPQIGWNSVEIKKPHAIFEGIEDGSEFYFVHSFYTVPSSEDEILGTTEYADVTFASVLGKDNVVATQFHPEKSGKIGMRLLENFTKWNGDGERFTVQSWGGTGNVR